MKQKSRGRISQRISFLIALSLLITINTLSLADESRSIFLPLIFKPGPPVSIVHDSITNGTYHSCALTPSGGIACWGWNQYGQLGDGTRTDIATPVDVVGLNGGIAVVEAGARHTCALTLLGGAKCWGDNAYGQLGDGTGSERLTPVDVLGLNTGVVAITAGGNHTCALMATGSVKCWGLNDKGQLGDNTTNISFIPVDVVGISDVVAISAGYRHTCAITFSGAVNCWGFNSNGQLGDGTVISSSIPVDTLSLNSGVVVITAGGSHTCALTVNDGTKCWGDNYYGQLGDGTVIDRLSPVDVVGLYSGLLGIEAADLHTCAISGLGGVMCWGYNGQGQLGDGTLTDQLIPTDVVGLSDGVTEVAVGISHVCARIASDALKCWGSNWAGQLGDGIPLYQTSPRDVLDLSSGAIAIRTGRWHTCALTTTGGVRCWGQNSNYQLGDDTSVSRSTPADVISISSNIAAVGTGERHSCAITSLGGLKCWGWNVRGQLGDGTTTSRDIPVDVLGLDSGVVAVAAGTYHTCALTMYGGVKCWGGNDHGQLGDGTTTGHTTPADVVNLSSGVIAIATGEHHTCALTIVGGVKCWGDNNYGQLGDGSTTDRLTPVNVVGLSSGIVEVVAGVGHTCALSVSGGLKCWGMNAYGQLGDVLTPISRSTPVDVWGLTSGVSAVTAGFYHTCALTDLSAMKCWGANWFGQLGDGTTTQQYTPVDVMGLETDISVIDSGYGHTCVLSTTDMAICWGWNNYGQLGDGKLIWSPVPITVALYP